MASSLGNWLWQRVLSNVGLGEDVEVWKSPIVYQILDFMLKVEAIVGLMARFLVKVTLFIELPSNRYKIRDWYM